jgi:hypothetical protein
MIFADDQLNLIQTSDEFNMKILKDDLVCKLVKQRNQIKSK